VLLSATPAADGRTVVLVLDSAVAGTFVVAVNGVQDLAGNLVAPGSTVTGQVPDVNASYLLFDFGASGTSTTRGPAPDDLTHFWNNVTAEVGSSSNGQLLNVVTMENTPTEIDFVIVRRFNGSNPNGTTAAAPFPTDATRDSLFGNTELFGGLENIFPSFKLTGLNRSLAYHFTFYASRTGVSDNRETGYTVDGATTGFTALNAANNVVNVARVDGIFPNALGEIAISLAPTANNNNVNHFTYLGVLRVDWSLPPRLSELSADGDSVRFRLHGMAGRRYRIEASLDFNEWTNVETVMLTGPSQFVSGPQSAPWRFLRAVALMP
jgi:hypothetical protein